MFPQLFHIGAYSQATYGVLVALAFVAALAIIGRLARRAGLNHDAVLNLAIYCALAAIVGAKIMMFLIDIPFYIRDPAQIFSLSSLQAGGVFYGGLIGALLAAIVYMRRKHLPPLLTADVFAPGIALGHGIGRLGCFAAGCCWGVRIPRLPWAVTFTNPVANSLVGVPLGIALHPTQLYESAAEFIIFGFLYWRIRRPHAPGAIISLYLILYSSVRFLVEFVRYHEQPNPFGGALNTSQWVSLALLALGAAYWVRLWKRRSLVSSAAILSLVVLTAALSACGSKPTEVKAANDRPLTQPALFTIPQEQIAHLRIAPVETTSWAIEVQTTGTVDWDADHTTQAITQVNGPITRILVDTGSRVAAGEPLLFVASPDVAGAISTYKKARNREDLARRIVDRSRELLDRGAIATKDFEGTQADLNDAATDVQNSLGGTQDWLASPRRRSRKRSVRKGPSVRNWRCALHWLAKSCRSWSRRANSFRPQPRSVSS